MFFTCFLVAAAFPTRADDTEEPNGPAATAEVQALLDEAERLRREKNAEAALAAADRALALARESRDVAGKAFSHGERAKALEALDRTDDALGAWQTAASSWESQGAAPERIDALRARMLLFARLRDSESLNRDLERVVAISRAEHDRPQAVVDELNEASERMWRIRRLQVAETLARAAMTIVDEHTIRPFSVAWTHNNLGIVAAMRGNLETAQSFFLRTLEIRMEHDPGSLLVAGSLSNLGIVTQNQGNLDAALDYHRRSLEIQETLAPGSLGVATSLNALGNVAEARGDLEAALGYFRRSMAIREKLAPDSLAVASSLNSLGNVAQKRGDADAALDYHRRALEIREKLVPGSLDVAASLNNLGLVAEDQGDLEAAVDYYRRSLRIKEKLAPGSLDVAGGLNNLGLVAQRQGDLEVALGYLQRALEIKEKLAPGSLTVAGSFNNLGLVAELQGDFEAALGYYHRSLEIREKLAPNSFGIARSLRNLGVVSEKQSDHGAAREFFARAWNVIRLQGRSVTGDEAWSAFAEHHASHAANLIRAEIRIGHPARALSVVEQSRAQGLLELFERRGLERVSDPKVWGTYEDSNRRLNQLGEQLANAASRVAILERDLADLEAQGMTGDELTAVREKLSQARSSRDDVLAAHTQARLEMQACLEDVRRSVPGLEPEALSLEAARGVLSSGTVFVAFSVGGKATIAIVIPSDPGAAIRGYVVDLTSKQLTKRVDFVRDRLGVGRVERGLALQEKSRLENASRALFRKLFPEDVRPVLVGAERVVISPDGPLWNLPFAALDMGDDDSPHWLGLEKSLSYTPSLTTLVQARRRAVSSEKDSVLIVGDPMPGAGDEKKSKEDEETPPNRKDPKEQRATAAVDSSSTGERTRLFPNGVAPDPLPGAREEARRLAKVYESEPLIGLDATESFVRARMREATIVHLATHGYFHPTHPMSSGVLLAPSKDEAATGTDTDGALQAWEILSSLNLRAELVVLSACETGLGRAVRGEGLVGLTRALQAAGANSVVATHWKVADDSTTELMVSFHEKLRAGIRKDDALRQAMREVAGRSATSHPYFWAAFFLSGGSE